MKPVVLVILDGVGIGKHDVGDAVFHANTPNLDRLLATCPHVQLKAHGTAVGFHLTAIWAIPKWATTRLAAARCFLKGLAW